MHRSRSAITPPSGPIGSAALPTKLLAVGVLAVLLGMISAHLFGLWQVRQQTAAEKSGPAVLTDDGTLRFGDPDADSVITVTVDYQCQLCSSFESVTGSYIDSVQSKHKIAIAYDLVAIRDSSSTTEYSSRAANASLCVAAADKGKWQAWHRAALAGTPADGSAGLTNQQLIDLADRSGVASPDLARCIDSGKYLAFVTVHTASAVAAGLARTPTVAVNGMKVGNLTPDGLAGAVELVQSRDGQR